MDISDIETALVDAISQSLCGVSLPGQVTQSDALAVPVRVYRGWPTPAALDADLAANVTNVSVFPMPGMTRIMPTHQREWRMLSRRDPSLTTSIAGNVVTFGGSGGAGQVAGIAAYLPRQTGWAYRLQLSDTPSTVAAALAAAIPGASVSGAGVTMPLAAARIEARVVCDQTASLELRYQSQEIKVTIWSASPLDRDAIAAATDLALMQVDRITIGDITTSPLLYRSSTTIDKSEAAALWRRDLDYTIGYPTTIEQLQPSVLFPWLSVDLTTEDGTVLASTLAGPAPP